MRIALAQILSGTDPAANLQLVREYSRRAADAGAQLVVFPEATMCRFGVPLGPVAEPLDGPWADGVRSVAAESKITVVAGMFTPAGDGRVKTRCSRRHPMSRATTTTRSTFTTRSASPNRGRSRRDTNPW